jgi:hypothetical protein
MYAPNMLQGNQRRAFKDFELSYIYSCPHTVDTCAVVMMTYREDTSCRITKENVARHC